MDKINLNPNSWEAFGEKKVSPDENSLKADNSTAVSQKSVSDSSKTQIQNTKISNTIDSGLNGSLTANSPVIDDSKKVSSNKKTDSLIDNAAKKPVPVALKVVLGLITLAGVTVNVIVGVFAAIYGFEWFEIPIMVLSFIQVPILLINSFVLFKAKSKNAFIVSYALSTLLYLGLSIYILVFVFIF